MPTLIDRNGPVADTWTWLDTAGDTDTDTDADTGAAATPGQEVRLILSFDQWRTRGEALLARGARIGICLDAGGDPAEIAGVLDRIDLVAVRFPSFVDGRGYSIARLLRQRYGWQGELRAVGDVLRDQMFYLSRCGFDRFDLKDGESVTEALAGLRDFSETYQSAADHGPLFKRRLRAPLASPLVAPPSAVGATDAR